MNWWKIGLIGVVVVGIAFGSFFMGRKTIKKNINEKDNVVYVDVKPITDTIIKPVPYKVVEPVDTLDIIKQCVADGKFYEFFPEKIRDTVIYVTKEDTTYLLRKFAEKKYYANTLFDIDTLGTCKYSAMVQYNELTMLGYEYEAKQKQTTTTVREIKKYSPFIGGGLTLSPSVVGQAGIFFEEKYGVAAQYRYEWKDKKSDIGLLFLYKF